MDFKYCKLEIFLPPSHLEVLQKALQEVDAGHIGNYDSCMSVSPVTGYWRPLAIDLLDTLKAHEEGCVGMAANMIGVKKRIIAVNMGFMNVAMFNPRIVKKSGSYQTEEGCLSLIGVRPCTRYQEIELEYQDMNWKKQRQKYTGWIAQIIQHEVDHCNGIII